ncbi:MAG: Uma2 family endonuclease [Myxococcales bacterium]|nr:Uma2 family endonuclease [Myxococcales bacterium]
MLTPVPIEPGWQRPLSVAEYHRMIDAGVFDEDERLELLEGVMVAMSPQGIPHAKVITVLCRRLFQVTEGASLEVRPQLPLTLARSEPEPDLAVTDARGAWPRGRHPETAHLVVEVASDSLRKDLGPKASIYAEAAVTEYWVVDVERQLVHRHGQPDPRERTYREVQVFARGATITSLALPALAVAVDDLF